MAEYYSIAWICHILFIHGLAWWTFGLSPLFWLMLLWTYVDSPEFSEPMKWEKLNSALLGKQFPHQGLVSFFGPGSLSVHPIWPGAPPGQDEPDSTSGCPEVSAQTRRPQNQPFCWSKTGDPPCARSWCLSFLRCTMKVLERGCSDVPSPPSFSPLSSGFLSPFLQVLTEHILCAMNWGFQQ